MSLLSLSVASMQPRTGPTKLVASRALSWDCFAAAGARQADFEGSHLGCIDEFRLKSILLEQIAARDLSAGELLFSFPFSWLFIRPRVGVRGRQAGHTLEGSIFAVSTSPIARVGSFCSLLRGLQDCHTFAPLETENLSKVRQTLSHSFLSCEKTRQFQLYRATMFVDFSTDYDQIVPEFRFQLFSYQIPSS